MRISSLLLVFLLISNICFCRNSLSVQELDSERLMARRQKIRAMIDENKKSKEKEIARLKAELLEEQIRNQSLTGDIDVFSSMIEEAVADDESEKHLRLNIDIMREEMRSLKKEMERLRGVNNELTDKAQYFAKIKGNEYEKRLKILSEKYSILKKDYNDDVAQEIKDYKKRNDRLIEYLDILTDGKWSLMNMDSGRTSQETVTMLEGINKAKKDVDELRKRMSSLESAYSRSSVLEEASRDPAGINKERALLYAELGRAHIRAGDYEHAIESFLRAVTTGSAPAEVHYFLGLLYEYVRHDSAMALDALNRYLYYEPVGVYAQKADKIISLINVTPQM